jgi:hypothetical protein
MRLSLLLLLLLFCDMLLCPRLLLPIRLTSLSHVCQFGRASRKARERWQG